MFPEIVAEQSIFSGCLIEFVHENGVKLKVKMKDGGSSGH